MAKRCYVDIGHGGDDPGAVDGKNAAEGDTLYTEEEDINLDCGLKLGAALVRCGVSVKYSRKADVGVSLKNRAAEANGWNADVFVSWHSNAATSSKARGIEVLHYPASTKGKALATNVYNRMDDVSPWADRGVKADVRGLYVLRATNMPAIIVECGFLTNTNEEKMLNSASYRTALAEAAAHGVCEHLGVPYKPKAVAVATPAPKPAPVVKVWKVKEQTDGRIVLTKE